MTAPEVVSLAAETKTAPSKGSTPYVAISDAADMTGGGTVYLTRNRKQVAKSQPGDAKPPVYLTAETGNAQQSIPYRGVGAALAADIVPMAQVVGLYVSAGRLGDLVRALLVDDISDDFAAELSAHETFLAENFGVDAEPAAPADATDLALS